MCPYLSLSLSLYTYFRYFKNTEMKGVCDLGDWNTVTFPMGDTPRIGAKGQIGSGESLGKCQETSLEYDIKERNNSNESHPLMIYSCYL